MEVKYSDCVIKEATRGDLTELCDKLRDQDVNEIKGLGVLTEYACNVSYENSDIAMTMRTFDGDLIACFGCGKTDTPTIATIWMLGTDLVRTVQSTFLRYSRTWIDYLLTGYDYGFNLISKDNTVSKRWLGWLNAEFFETQDTPAGYEYFLIRKGGY